MNELLYYDLKNVSGLTPGLATQVCREIGRRIVAGLFPEGHFIDDESKLSLEDYCYQFADDYYIDDSWLFVKDILKKILFWANLLLF